MYILTERNINILTSTGIVVPVTQRCLRHRRRRVDDSEDTTVVADVVVDERDATTVDETRDRALSQSHGRVLSNHPRGAEQVAQ